MTSRREHYFKHKTGVLMKAVTICSSDGRMLGMAGRADKL